MNPDDLRCQRMYFLYKAHKIPPFMRPIVSGVKGPTETASWVLNEALKMILPNTKYSYILAFWIQGENASQAKIRLHLTVLVCIQFLHAKLCICV